MKEKKNKIIYSHRNMYLEYMRTPNGLHQIAFNPEKVRNEMKDGVPFPNFQLAVAGKPFGFSPALTTGYTIIPLEMQMEKTEKTEGKIIFRYRHEELGLVVLIEMMLIPDTSVVRQFTSVINEGNDPVTITHLSSMCMQGIASDGCLPWHDNRKVKVHYCLQTWEGEGQWRCGDLEELGLYPTSTHPCAAAIHFSSVGSWSTGRYLPMAVIEDMETGKVWYFQIEATSNWHFEMGYRGSWTDSSGALFIQADAADERFGNWTRKLLPGESFDAVPTAVGCCMGGFDSAVRELTKYRRTILKQKNLWDDSCPVIFNDYMNCLWGNPSRDKLLPLIDTAASVGAEYFCIDAGWFSGMDKTWEYRLGDWEASAERFGKEGLLELVKYMKAKGIIPGLWMEMEVCGESSELGKKPDSWFLLRNEKRVGGGARWFLNFSNKEVREYMHRIIDKLLEMGIGYIKNDYNSCIGNGKDIFGGSPANGLIEHSRAFYGFIDEVRNKHPQLIIENCGSGGMRQDYGVLSHFHIQSSSDQEIYHKYPSIIGGSLAAVLPEQLGIWAYPYPLLYTDMNRPDILNDYSYQNAMADGEQTIFNMVNGMCGVMYLSGFICNADENNLSLIKEGISLYKKERKHIQNSYPFWPVGFTRINNSNSWASVGLANSEGSRLLLAVWRLGSAEEYAVLPIHKCKDKAVNVRQLYPDKKYEVEFYFNRYKGNLTVHLPKTYQARLFEITV